MVSGHDEDSQLARALAGGKPHPTGWFRLYFEDERWEWSPEVERLHGYEPGTAKPTTSMVLSHKHPEDYEQVAATLDDIRRTHQPFSTRHRIIDVQGRIHEVIVVAELLRDDGGEVIGTNGFYVDVTFPPEERESFISDAVAEIAANRAVIEEVKGILMIVYRIDADAAFDLLKWRSQAAKHRARHRADGEQHRRHLRPPLGQLERHRIAPNDATPMHDVDHRRKRHPETRQHDVPAQRNRHLLPGRKQTGRSVARHHQHRVADPHRGSRTRCGRRPNTADRRERRWRNVADRASQPQ